ncbi:class I SAM-dependent methyltransferase [Leisingera sp. JC11]|uniref:class I SAM-dependent methyltransferase n=1 Tax=Leisingera sp. JC11 TaxID=3042469 RepID=UPI003451F72E
MGKRSNFKRRPQDKYRTFDMRAAAALAPHLRWGCRFWEPCAGAADLVRGLQSFGAECVVATDISPECEGVYRLDALAATAADVDATGVTDIITNPVWSRALLHAMIMHFSAMRPTWLLFDADWMHTRQAAPYLPHLRKIVSVGRLIWIEGTNQTGKDNCAWYLFDQRGTGPIEFIGRAA